MQFENLKVETTGGIRRITINRPEKLNALNVATVGELGRAIEETETDDSIDAVVITGAGEKAFVAGADISELATLGPVEAKEFAIRGQEVFRAIERFQRVIELDAGSFERETDPDVPEPVALVDV